MMVLLESGISEGWNTADMGSAERNSLFIRELEMTIGSAWGSLRKIWRLVKLALRAAT
jgi:hypothetical protein